MAGSTHKNKRQPGYQSERGERQEARILDALVDGPKTAYELRDLLHLTRKNVHVYLDRLMERPNRRVYVSGFNLSGGRPMFLFDLGSKNNITIDAFQQKRLMTALEDLGRPSTNARVAAHLGMSYGTAKRYMNALKKKGRVHIADWEWSHKTPVALYLAGRGEDSPKPTKWPEAMPARNASRRTNIFSPLGL